MKKQRRHSNKISMHFAKRDFVCKCGKCENALKISLGLIGGLEMLRFLSRNRINIVRGYMCPDAAEKIGSIKRNYYTMGIAADITVDNVDPREVFRIAAEIPEFRGIGLNLDAQFVHVDTRKAQDPQLWVEQHHTTIPIDASNRDIYLPPRAPLITSDALPDVSED